MRQLCQFGSRVTAIRAELECFGMKGAWATRIQRRRRWIGVLLVLTGLCAFPLFPANAAKAISRYYWYTPSGPRDLWNTRTTPGSPLYGHDTVGPGWLGSSSGASGRMLGGPCTTCGGIDADIATTKPGDYCNQYRFPIFWTNSGWPFGRYTGFYPSRPSQSYQQTDGASQQASTCQAESEAARGWGQWMQPADNPTNCWNCGPRGIAKGCGDCGIEHYVSFAGTANYPWSTRFGDPELTVQDKTLIRAYSDHWSPGATSRIFAWHYLCPVLGARYNGAVSYIELCADEWQSKSTTDGKWIIRNENSAGCQTAHIVEAIGSLNPSNPAGYFFTTIAGSGQSGTIYDGALGRYWWEATVTAQNLANVIAAIPSPCSGNYSKDISSYRLVGIEDGIESGEPCAANTTCNFYLNYFGTSESLLQAWTAY